MKRSTFIANAAVWGVISAICVVFLAWSASVGGDFGDNIALLTMAVFAKPVGAFSIAALLTTSLVHKFDLKLGHGMRIAWRVLGVVPAVAFMLSPFMIPVLPSGAATAFAVVLLAAMAIPVLFLLLGLFYGLSLAGEKPDEDEEDDAE